jgi:hypothetical protein
MLIAGIIGLVGTFLNPFGIGCLLIIFAIIFIAISYKPINESRSKKDEKQSYLTELLNKQAHLKADLAQL